MIDFFKYTINGAKDRASLAYNASYDDNTATFYMKFDDVYWFESELTGLNLLADKQYCPTIINVNRDSLTIQVKWGESLNHMLYTNTAPVSWKDDVKKIIDDLESDNIYKLNLFNHTFFYENNVLKLIDVYGCLSGDAIVQFEDLASVLTTTSKERFAPFIDEAGNLKIKEIYSVTKKNNVGHWPGDFLNG